MLLAAEGLRNNAEVSFGDYPRNIRASLQNKSYIKLKIKDIPPEGWVSASDSSVRKNDFSYLK